MAELPNASPNVAEPGAEYTVRDLPLVGFGILGYPAPGMKLSLSPQPQKKRGNYKASPQAGISRRSPLSVCPKTQSFQANCRPGRAVVDTQVNGPGETGDRRPSWRGSLRLVPREARKAWENAHTHTGRFERSFFSLGEGFTSADCRLHARIPSAGFRR